MANQCFLIGNLSRDVELRRTQDGKAVANFSIAVNDAYDKVNFFPIVVWGNQAENCAKYLKKGSKVGIVGRLQNRSYDTSDGVKKTITEIVANEIDFLSPKEKPELKESEELYQEELPF